MTDETPRTDNSNTNKKKSSPLTMLALIGLLAGALGLSYVDRSARSACDEAYKKVEAALEGEETVEHTTVHEWMGKEPDRVLDNELSYSEEFDFNGVIRKQKIIVGYSKGATKLLSRVARE